MLHQRRVFIVVVLSCLALLAGSMPVLTRGAGEELAREDPQATADWQEVVGEGFSIRIPPGWASMQAQGRIIGVYTLHLIGPVCDANVSSGCQTEAAQLPAELRISVEQTNNESTPPGDEVRGWLQLYGYAQKDVLVRNNPALLFNDPGEVATAARVVTLEQEQVIYRIWMSAELSQQTDLAALLLGTLDFVPASAPTAYRASSQESFAIMLPLILSTPIIDIPPITNLPASSSQAATEGLAGSVPQSLSNPVLTSTSTSYSANLAVAEANEYALKPTNRDTCYVYAIDANGAGAICYPDPSRPVRIDGAHFIDCVLKAAHLPGAICDGTTSSLISMFRLLSVITQAPHTISTDSHSAQPGDIFVLYGDGVACWGGVVVQTGAANPSGIWVAAHSADTLKLNPDAAECDATNYRREYIHIIGDTTPPTVWFTAPQPGRIAPGVVTVSASADDGPDGTGVRSYTFQMSVDGEPAIDIARDSGEAQSVRLDIPCRAITLSVTATDNAGNISSPAYRALTTGLPGDSNADGLLDETDLAAITAAWDVRSGQPEYNPVLDVNADGQIDATDTLWLHRHLGDRCQ